MDLDKRSENREISETLTNCREPFAVIVEMNKATELPADIISYIAGKNINMILNMEDGISWCINGNSVTGEKFSDIDLTVYKNTNKIPPEIARQVSGKNETMQIEMAHGGELGFTATLTINLGSRNAGCYAKLFCFDGKTEELEFVSYGQIDEDGNVALDFTCASAYTIVITDYKFSENNA